LTLKNKKFGKIKKRSNFFFHSSKLREQNGLGGGVQEAGARFCAGSSAHSAPA
jgi:hypothetical protein